MKPNRSTGERFLVCEREFVVDSGASMHVVSKKDLNSAEWRPWGHRRIRRRWWREKVRCKPDKKPLYLSKNWTYLSKLCFLKKLPQFFLWGNSVRVIGIHTTGPAVKNHIPSEMAIELIATYPTMYHSCFLVYQRVLPQLHLHLLLHHLHHKITYLMSTDTPKIQYPKEAIEPWRNPEQGSRDTSKSSHELPMEPRAKVEPGSGKHCVKTHFPKDPNCDVCLKTKITRASGRRRAGTVTKFFAKDVNHDTLLWYKIWQLSGYNPTRAKQKISRNPWGNQESFTLTIP